MKRLSLLPTSRNPSSRSTASRLAARFASRCVLTLAATVGLLSQAPAHAHEYYAKGFKIIHPWTLPSEPGESSAAVYLKFEDVSAGDRLLGAHSSFAASVELRSALAPGSVSENSAVLKALAVTVDATPQLAPRGVHLLMLGLKAPLETGRSYPLTLVFENSGEIDTMLSIGAAD